MAYRNEDKVSAVVLHVVSDSLFFDRKATLFIIFKAVLLAAAPPSIGR